MENILQYISQLSYNNVLAVWLYWAPMAFCLIFYSTKTIREYSKEKIDLEVAIQKQKENSTSWLLFYPSLTIGVIIGRICASVIPFINIFAALIDLGPEVFRRFFLKIGQIFDYKLVRAPK